MLDYNYLKKLYKMKAIDLSKTQVLDVDSKAIQQISFTGNLDNNAVIFFIVEKLKETVWNFNIELKSILILILL